jgi:hypothetical protein
MDLPSRDNAFVWRLPENWESEDSAAYNVTVARSQINLLEPWSGFLPGQGEAFLEELYRELSSGHLLEGRQLVPLGHSGAGDEAVFEAEDGRVFHVHLTFSRHSEPTPLPHTRVYSKVDEWVQEVLLPAHEEWRR